MRSVAISRKMDSTARRSQWGSIADRLRSTGPNGGGFTARRGTVARSPVPGRPRKQRADWITMVAASVFLWLTGALPALRTNSEGVAYGPFLDFLKAVFEACGITASAEARVKAFGRKFCPPRDLVVRYGENSAKNSN